MVEIIIADDDPVARQILTDILAYGGYHVTTGTCGKEAITLVSSAISNDNPPAAVFLDMMLGDMTGIDVVETLQSLHTLSFPVIFLSANAKADIDILHGKSVGDHFLEKPFTAKTILPLLDEILKK